MKKIIKSIINKVAIKALEDRTVRQAIRLNQGNSLNSRLPSYNHASPYISHEPPLEFKGEGVIFITSRFRSGSTLLWNLFRSVEGCTSYYEPFNERKWFDAETRGSFVDNTHLGVNDYWQEYEELSDLSKYYNEKWIHQQLYMDQRSYNPDMEDFIDCIIENTKGLTVLQFNRIDFRLPWIKKHYPKAKIIHLYRNPREVWCSFLVNKEVMTSENIEYTYQDAFYLDVWCDDLADVYPFLDPKVTRHPYQRFYYLWKLSYLFGIEWADQSVAFEDLVYSPHECIRNMFEDLPLNGDIEQLATVIQPPPKDKWREFANDEWFLEHERQCESTLSLFFNRRYVGGKNER
ncbi:conserved hypothetical protein [Alteromonas macleodii]|jgi:hypothetical protein|uniref:sulfotransferase n=1 Tax=Alteromonas sp. BZK5 TaxID=1904459 RepID=UPI001653C4FB|nr:sulfotransferase [Alteromonas sp. BZK5]MBC6986904.1 sulfotransferase [Alteromonas sp. BZK5]